MQLLVVVQVELKMRLISFLLLSASCLSSSYAYPDGAPPEACDSLKPSHEDHEAQNSQAPYTITTDKTRVRAGEEVLITIQGNSGETFRGFIMVGREPGKKSNLGQFASGDQSGTLTCQTDADAATHSSGDDKNEVVVSWIAPTGYEGKVQFTATIVHAFEQYWSGVESRSITVY